MANRYNFMWCVAALGMALGAATFVEAASDSAYTGSTNNAAATPPAPVKHKKKKAKTAADSAASTNSVTSPTPPVASTNAAPAEVSPPALTNAPAKTEPAKSPTDLSSESEATKTITNSMAKPSAPVASTNSVVSPTAPTAPVMHVATLSPSDLKEFADQPPAVQALITRGLELTQKNLKYQYGSDDPKNGGMDCSGTVYYLLKESGLKDVPRDASGLYSWLWKEGRVEPVVSSNPKTFELSRLKPGDLLFWIGTYDVDHDPPISHVMIYLGTNLETGKPVMVGASEGRRYGGKSQYGVSVFDFELPRVPSKAETAAKPREYEGRFIGYGSVPGL